ncbi:MAG: 4Fe-4S binding protein [Thermodesulfovibrionales bacterium]
MINRSYVRRLRLAVQWAVFALVLYGGYRFYLFTEHFLSGTPLVQRPPLVDGFLPIGGLMALRLWVQSGFFDPVHPAALVILLAAILMAVLLKKSFCGWICPVGALSEAVFKAGGKVFGRNFELPSYVDYPLRSLKYLLLAFFVYAVLFKMPLAGAAAFLSTPYWKVADVKMLEFFTAMSLTSALVIAALVALSLFYKNFWCRYLCPYGALLGMLSWLSPLKVTRDTDACVKCGKCARVCPASLPVDRKLRIRSAECTGCLTCVSGCPARGALDVALPGGRKVKPMVFASLVLALFFGLIGGAKVAGKWHSSVSYEEYKAYVPAASRFEHP